MGYPLIDDLLVIKRVVGNIKSNSKKRLEDYKYE